MQRSIKSYFPQNNNNQNKAKQVEVIAPGFVFMKKAITEEQQIALAKLALEAGADETRGFWLTKPDGQKVLNSAFHRGRIYNVLTTFANHEMLSEICLDLVATAREHNDQIPEMQPTHLLLLYYTGTNGMGWHRDSGANDGDNDHPIVSISIGNSCVFGYQVSQQGRKKIILESGDVAVWGGPLRMMMHNVGKVYSNTAPVFLPKEAHNVRLNFTFRDAPNILGREAEFAYFVQSSEIKHVMEDIKQDKERKVLEGQKMKIDKENEKEIKTMDMTEESGKKI